MTEKHYHTQKNLNKIRPYLKKDIINNLKKSDTWKIQSTITINFISFKDDSNEECVMHSKSNNTEVMINDKAEKIIEEYMSLPSITFIYCITNIIK